MGDIYRSASCLSSWIRGTQWVIYTGVQVALVAGYACGTRYAVSDIYTRVQVALVADYAVRAIQ